MWISAEIIDKQQTKTGYRISVLYSTDDAEPRTEPGFVDLGPGQDESTLKGAIVQQLADLNAQSQKQKDDFATLAVIVSAIPLGLIDTKSVDIGPVDVKP